MEDYARTTAARCREEGGGGPSEARRNTNYWRHLNKGRTLLPARRRKQPGPGRSSAFRLPSASLLVAAALLSLISLTALPPFVMVAAEEPAQATAAAQLPPSRKRPRARAERQERRRALGDLSHILSARTHPHPEPTSSPSAGPPFYGGESDGGESDGGGELPQMMPPPPAPTTGEEDSEVPQPRNERPWDEDEEEEEVELGDFTNSTDSDDTKGRGEDNKLVPPDDGDGTTDLDLLDEDDDDTDDPNNNADDKDEVIDVSPVEPSPALTTAALPVTDDPTGSPTGAPAQRPSPGEFS